ncbi:MAG: peptide chain release factor-like protein [Lentisphaerae bacterium]|nr:peptide chain release factor-like protein [Lentisphaerota bacterium]
MDKNRNIFLQQDDNNLSALCRITFTKGSGPGGQKRNKTSTAVKVELPQYRISATDCTERSQLRNRSNALRKLRIQIALNFRLTPAEPPESMACSLNSPGYPLFAAKLLDVLSENSFDHHQAAAVCNCSGSALLKKLYRDPELWQFFQKQRRELGLPALHPPK